MYIHTMAEMRNAWKNVVGKPEGKRLLEDLGVYGKIL
jgi:hypothetical protein